MATNHPFQFFCLKVILIQGKGTILESREINEGPWVVPRTHCTFKLHYEVDEPKILVIVRSRKSEMPDDPEDRPSALDLIGEICEVGIEIKGAKSCKNAVKVSSDQEPTLPVTSLEICTNRITV